MTSARQRGRKVVDLMKVGIYVVALFSAMFGLLIFILKWKVGQVDKSIKTLFDLYNTMNDRLRATEIDLARTKK